MANPRVLIVIVVYNGVEYLDDCLSSLARCTFSQEFTNILVVDNASTDSSAEYVQRQWPQIKFLGLKENIGFAAGNNVGFQYAIEHDYDFVYLLNQDTVVAPDFLDQALEVALMEKNVGAVQSKLLLHSNPKKINSSGNEIHFLGFAFAGGYLQADHEMPTKEITYASGACVLFSLAAIKIVGQFNPEFFMYHEDTDLGWRLWLGGYRVLLAPKSVVYHKYEFSKSIKKYYYMERNRHLVLLQNLKIGTLIVILPALVFMDGAMIVYSLFSGWWPQESAAHSYFFSFKNWQRLLMTRRSVQRKRTVPDRAVISRFSGTIGFQETESPLLKYVANPLLNVYWQLIKKIIWW